MQTSAVLTIICGALAAAAFEIVEPPPGGGYDFVPDIPLWVRIDQKGQTGCFDLLLDGVSITITCEADTVLSGTVPAPGEHQIELVPTFKTSSSGPMVTSTFTVTNNNPIPAHLTKDGLTITVPEFVHEYHKWWHQTHVWLGTSWMGVSAQKQPMDLWNYQEVLYEVKPSLLLEIGTRFGGTTLYFSGVMKAVHNDGSPYKILTVDIEHTGVVSDKVREEDKVELLEAPSACLRVQERVRALREEYPGPMFVILDADHGMDNVTLELQMITPLMSEGDYMIVEDTNLDGHVGAVAPGWGPCPYDAIIEFMAMNRGMFQRDLEREYKFGFSQSVAGFLKFKGTAGAPIVNPLAENPYLHA